MANAKKLLIIGNSGFAEIAAEYFTFDSDYSVVGFSVERAYRQSDTFCEKPNVDFESLEDHFPPDDHAVFVAVTYTQLNRLRARLTAAAKYKGYSLASYVSSRAFVWRNAKMGEHCFVFEDNTVQPFVSIGNNVVLWSGNHIGHHSIVEDNCFISSHVVISGYCEIGRYTFLGVNATLANNVTIGEDNWIGPGVTISRNTERGALFNVDAIDPARVSALRFFKIKD